MSDAESMISEAVSESLSNAPITDSFYGTIADKIVAHSDKFVLSGSLAASLAPAFVAVIPEGSEIMVETFTISNKFRRVLLGYEGQVRSDLASSAGITSTTLAEICTFELDVLGVIRSVPKRKSVIIDEIVEMNGMNPHGGVTDLPGTDSFHLEGDDGAMTVETLNVEISFGLVVREVLINRGRCVHTVRSCKDLSATYFTVFTTEVADILDVRTVESGAISGAMRTSSSVIRDLVDAAVVLEITVISRWALDGIEYVQSSTFYSDSWVLMPEVLEPLIKPLR